MKSILAAALVIAALVPAVPARAQVFGQYTGASVTPANGHVFGAYLNVSEHVVGGLAQLRMSFYPNLDFGFHGGISRIDPGPGLGTRTTLRLGGDLRYQLAGLAPTFPADMAIGGSLAVETSDNFKVISLGPSVVASRTMGAEGGTRFIPYAGLAILFSSRDAFGVQDSDISVPLRLGFEARVAPELRFIAEMQLFITDRYNDDIGFVTGVNLPF